MSRSARRSGPPQWPGLVGFPWVGRMVMSMIGVDVVVVGVVGLVVQVVRGGRDEVLDGVGVEDPVAGALLEGAVVRCWVREAVVADEVRTAAADPGSVVLVPVGAGVCVVATGS